MKLRGQSQFQMDSDDVRIRRLPNGKWKPQCCLAICDGGDLPHPHCDDPEEQARAWARSNGWRLAEEELPDHNDSQMSDPVLAVGRFGQVHVLQHMEGKTPLGSFWYDNEMRFIPNIVAWKLLETVPLRMDREGTLSLQNRAPIPPLVPGSLDALRLERSMSTRAPSEPHAQSTAREIQAFIDHYWPDGGDRPSSPPAKYLIMLQSALKYEDRMSDFERVEPRQAKHDGTTPGPYMTPPQPSRPRRLKKPKSKGRR